MASNKNSSPKLIETGVDKEVYTVKYVLQIAVAITSAAIVCFGGFLLLVAAIIFGFVAGWSPAVIVFMVLGVVITILQATRLFYGFPSFSRR